MDIGTIKPKAPLGLFDEGSSPGRTPGNGSDKLPVSFNDLLKTGGISAEGNLGALFGKSRVDTPASEPISSTSDQRDLRHDRTDTGTNDDGDDYSSTSKADDYRGDIETDEQETAYASDDSPDQYEGASETGSNEDASASAGNENESTDVSDAGEAGEDDAPEDVDNDSRSAEGEDDGEGTGDTAQTGDGNETTESTDTETPTLTAETGTSQAETILTGLLASATEGALPANASSQAVANASSQRVNAVGGLERALQAVGSNSGQQASETGTTGATAQNNNVTGDGTNNSANNGTNASLAMAKGADGMTTPTTGPLNSQGTARENAQVTDKPTAQTSSNNAGSQVARAQAMDLTSTLNDGDEMSVRVRVSREGSATASQGASQGASRTSAAGSALTGMASAANASNGNLGTSANQGPDNAAVQITPGQGQQTSGKAADTQAIANTAARAVAQAGTTAQPLQSGGEQTTTTVAGTTETSQSQKTQSAATTSASRAPTMQRPVVEQVTVQITKALEAGMDRVKIQLKPAHLGRIDVQMEVTQDGRVSVVVTADRKDTFELLQQDSQELQKALKNAGLQTDSDSLSFNLREQGDGETGNQNADAAADGNPHNNDITDQDEPTLEDLLAGVSRGNSLLNGRIDIQA